MEKEICLIAAVADNRVIGFEGNIPWPRIPGDMKRFVEFTTSRPVIMGRKTYDTLKGPLKNRWNIIVSRNPEYVNHSVTGVARNFEDALRIANRPEYGNQIWIIGGGEIYSQTINLANRLEITEVHANYQGDSYFPEIKKDRWIEIKRDNFPLGENYPAFSFVSYRGVENVSCK